MKRLIVNADDFGLTRGVNRAIVDAHQQGAVTSATLMANGPEFDNAVNLARFTPSLGVGCHIDLVQLAPVSTPGDVPSLLDGDGDGETTRFRQGIARFAAALLAGRLSGDEVSREAAAQIRKLQATGLRITHFDTHQHTHALIPVLRPLLRAARECGVRAVRNPFEPHSLVRVRDLDNWRLRARYCALRALSSMAREFRRQVEQAGLVTTAGTVGVVLTGALDQQNLCELLRRVPGGTWELVTHPGYAGPELAPLSSLVASRDIECTLLTSEQTRRQLQACGIELVSYAALTGN